MEHCAAKDSKTTLSSAPDADGSGGAYQRSQPQVFFLLSFALFAAKSCLAPHVTLPPRQKASGILASKCFLIVEILWIEMDTSPGITVPDNGSTCPVASTVDGLALLSHKSPDLSLLCHHSQPARQSSLPPTTWTNIRKIPSMSTTRHRRGDSLLMVVAFRSLTMYSDRFAKVALTIAM